MLNLYRFLRKKNITFLVTFITPDKNVFFGNENVEDIPFLYVAFVFMSCLIHSGIKYIF